MGKRRQRGGRGGGGGGTRRAPVDDDYRTDLLDKAAMNNAAFTKYYKAQNIVPETEWEELMDALRRPLPTTFRVAGSRQTAQSLNNMIKDLHVPNLSNVIFEGEHIPPPTQLPWYPDGLAWHFNVPKKVLRKTAEFKKFHSFLVFETEVGNISRSEAVSMLPPLFLEVEPHHITMDMCAAPGSKTAQLLEALHARDTITSTSIPSGLLLANDSDAKRTHLLIHQSARLPSPAFMVTNIDASNYPNIKIPTAGGNKTNLLFDRILCDVPCGGDGTIRKNLGIWKTWQPNDGNGLHGLQTRILERAMKMLKQDGRLVYSTCSLNPVENEAVIASALLSNPDFELVDVSPMLPELKRTPGLTSWKATNDKQITTLYDTYEEFLAENQDSQGKMGRSHWPPADVESLNLPRCMRIYPHLQDSGGFFVAVLQRKPAQPSKKRGAAEVAEAPEVKKPKIEDEATAVRTLDTTMADTETEEGDSKEPLSAKAINEATAAPTLDATMGEAKTEEGEETPATLETEGSSELVISAEKQSTGANTSFKENPYTFLPPDNTSIKTCVEQLHLTSDFPFSNVLVRNPEGDAVRSMYLTNDIVRKVIENNDYSRIRLTAAGTKVFAKQESGPASRGEPQFRILGEGLPVVLPYVDPATIITTDIPTLKVLVESYYPFCSSFSEPFKSIIEARSGGCHIIRLEASEADGVRLPHEIDLPLWKSNVSVTLMIDKKAKSAFSLRIFGEDLTTAGKKAIEDKNAKIAEKASKEAL